MKKAILTTGLALFLLGCGDAGPDVSEKPVERAQTDRAEPETVAAHTVDRERDAKAAPTVADDASADKETAASGKADKPTTWTRGGDPIDVTEYNAAIARAEKDLKAKPDDPALKKKLSEAYTRRGVALTEARQYAAAIGDYRKAVRYDPANEDAKKWISTITNIYRSMKREVPAEGEEPAPLEMKKSE